MKPLSLSFVFLALAGLVVHAQGQALDSFLSKPDLWRTPRADFVDQHRDLGFYWVSDTRDHAETHQQGVTLFSSPVCQADVSFEGEKITGVTVSIYNRGDAGNLEPGQWTTLLAGFVQGLTALTRAQPVVEGREEGDAVKANAVSWQTPVSRFLLEYSFTKEMKSRNIPFRAEFMRLKVTPAEKPKSFMAAALASASPAVHFDGPSHVKRDPSGDVRIDTVPMVDQGRKGYCVVATAERVMRYYGIPTDEHELAELANSSATAGTSNEAMFDSLKKLSQRLRVKIRTIDSPASSVRQILDLIGEYNRLARRKHVPELPDQGRMLNMEEICFQMKPDLLKEARTHNKAEVDRFQHEVSDCIDQGIPVLWSVMLGLVPEQKAPAGMGGHMRLIIGYNVQTQEILYSDSWGPGHELKRMPADDAWTITTALDAIEPL